MDQLKLRVRHWSDFFVSPQPCNALAEMRAKVAEDDSTSGGNARAALDWSYLSGKVVGAEGDTMTAVK